jgi:hypothetical protein
MITLHGTNIKVLDIRYGWSEVVKLHDRALYCIVTNYT